LSSDALRAAPRQPARGAPLEAPPRVGRRRAWLPRLLFRLRPEEAVALLFLLPTTYLTLTANLYARRAGIPGDRQPGGLLRLAVVLALLSGLALALKLWRRTRAVELLREVLPFLTCILIYTNLHDTIGFVNGRDVHDTLIAIDQAVFGLQASVWAERFVTPRRSELMSFLYMSFFWIAPSTSLILLGLGRWRQFRAATMGVLVCFYLGYVLYVLFPAAPPRLVLLHEYTKSLEGYPRLFGRLSAAAFQLLPVDSRAAFPSLHAAVSLVALAYAWRHLRRWFWMLLPFALGLWVSTIYLRHHYVVDLVAGWALAPVAVWLAPRVDRWWSDRQRELGQPTAIGARR
jgi:membrane-associated phospholipid phosphatase